MRNRELYSLLLAILALPNLLSAAELTLTLPADTFVTREPVPITLAGLPGNAQDWLTLVAADKSDDSFGVWEYTKGVTEGTWTFTAPRPGDYEVRVYFDYPAGGFTVQARKGVKIVSKASPVVAQAETPDVAAPSSPAQPKAVDKPDAPDPMAQLREKEPMEQWRKKQEAQRQANEPQDPVTSAEIQQEADYLYGYCVKQSTYSALNDCQCIREKFVQERTANPIKGVDPIQMATKFPPTACPNGDGVRAFYFNRCGSSPYTAQIKSGLEEYCACYADEIKTLYMQQPSRTFARVETYASIAMSTCDKKGLPSPLNPDRTVAETAPIAMALDADGFEPVPDLCPRPTARYGATLDRHSACRLIQNAENPGSNPINVNYFKCLFTKLKDAADKDVYGIKQICEKSYGPPM